MQLFLEKTFPYFVALAGALLWWQLDVAFPTGEGILGSSLTIGAILTGFLATAKAILMALDSPVMQRIRQTAYLSDLVSYLSQAIWLSFSFCWVSLLGYFINTASLWYGLMWITVALATASAFIRVTNIMLKILQYQGN